MSGRESTATLTYIHRMVQFYEHVVVQKEENELSSPSSTTSTLNNEIQNFDSFRASSFNRAHITDDGHQG